MLFRWWSRWQHAPLAKDKTGTAACWMPVVPVHLIADRDTLVLMPRDSLPISSEEAQALVTSFSHHFADEGFCLVSATASDWWLGSNSPWNLKFPSVRNAESMNLRDAFQQGQDAAKWRKLLNEAQMLWFSHDVNGVRRDQGMPDINGFWPV